MQTHLTEDDLVLHYYGEMSNADEARTASHLGECPRCHDSYRQLQRVLAAVDETAFAVPELPSHFERTVWARLEPNLRRDRGWLSWFALSPGRLAWAASVLVLVAGAFFAGRLFPQRAPDAPAQASASQAQIRDRILLIDLSDHLDRSQMVLLELVSRDGDQTDFADERARAEQLLAANRLYRLTASSSGNGNIAQFLDDLELLLVDLAASPEQVSAETLNELRHRIESKGLLFKVRALSSEVRERQRTAYESRSGQRSTL
jgi:hypothetical protein